MSRTRTLLLVVLWACLSSSSGAASPQASDKLIVMLDAVKSGDPARVERALKAGGNPTDGLHEAIRANRIDIARMLMRAGANPNKPLPVLPAAVENGYAEMVTLLLERGADPNRGSLGVSPLHQAAEMGRLDLVKSLVERGANVNQLTATAVPEDAVTPLMVAAKRGRADVVAFLLQQGAKTAVGSYHYATLKYAAESNDPATLTLVLDNTIKPTPEALGEQLLNAVDVNAAANVELLLKRGANPRGLRRYRGQSGGFTALSLAAANANVALITRFLDLGIDPNVRTPTGSTALWEVLGNVDHAKTADQMRAAVALLLKRGANPRVVTEDGTTLLMAAAARHLADVVVQLLDLALDPNAADRAGNTALVHAFLSPPGESGTFLRGQTARRLVERGARLLGNTPGNFAALSRFADDPEFVAQALNADGVSYPVTSIDAAFATTLIRLIACDHGTPYGDMRERLCKSASTVGLNSDLWRNVPPDIEASLTVDLYALTLLRNQRQPELLQEVVRDLELKAEDCLRTGSGPIKVRYSVSTQQDRRFVDGWTVYFKSLKEMALERLGKKSRAAPRPFSGETSPATDWIDATRYWMCAERAGSGFAPVVREAVDVSLQNPALLIAVREQPDTAPRSCVELAGDTMR
jgi:ankyrin repeat protein